LSGSHGPGTAAHEAGHHLFGEMRKDGKWHNLSHPLPSSDPDKTPLMRDGGAGFKIQFDLALQARKFISQHHGAGAGKKWKSRRIVVQSVIQTQSVRLQWGRNKPTSRQCVPIFVS